MKRECCRECRDQEPPVDTLAEFILWGKLFPPEALGPRCYDHTAKHIGWSGMSRIDQYAVYDLRPINAHLDGSPEDCPQCGWGEDCVCDKPTARNDGSGATDSGVAQAGSGGAVEAERRQDQAEPCDTAPPTNPPEVGP